MRHMRITLALMLALGLGGCANTLPASSGEGGNGGLSGIEMLGRTELPPGSRILPEQSHIIGSGDNWVGRVVLDVGKDTSVAYSFFLERFPAQGWTLLSAVRSKTSLIVLTKQDRNATIEIQEGNVVGGASAVLTISPRNATVSAPKKP